MARGFPASLRQCYAIQTANVGGDFWDFSDLAAAKVGGDFLRAQCFLVGYLGILIGFSHVVNPRLHIRTICVLIQ